MPIWEGIRDYFAEQGVNFDYVLFSNYERQVEPLFQGFIDIAWNTNLASVKTDRRLNGKALILAMRDTDIAFRTKIVVSAAGTLAEIGDLRGKRVAFGSRDSAQAAVIPEYYLRRKGLCAERDYKAVRFNTDVGKHGDIGRSEQDVLVAVRAGQADAGAVGESTCLGSSTAGGEDLRVIWTSPPYSHCNFTALPSLDPKKAEAFVSALMKMDYDNPVHRPILEMEGLKRWVKGSRDGFQVVFAADDELGYDMVADKDGAVT